MASIRVDYRVVGSRTAACCARLAFVLDLLGLRSTARRLYCYGYRRIRVQISTDGGRRWIDCKHSWIWGG